MTIRSEWADLNEIRAAIQSPRGPSRGTTRNVLLALCSFANSSCICFPGHIEIAKRAGLCTRTVQTHVKYGVQEGWILRNRRWIEGSKHYHTVYLLRIPELRLEGLSGGGGLSRNESYDRQIATEQPEPFA